MRPCTWLSNIHLTFLSLWKYWMFFFCFRDVYMYIFSCVSLKSLGERIVFWSWKQCFTLCYDNLGNKSFKSIYYTSNCFLSCVLVQTFPRQSIPSVEISKGVEASCSSEHFLWTCSSYWLSLTCQLLSVSLVALPFHSFPYCNYPSNKQVYAPCSYVCVCLLRVDVCRITEIQECGLGKNSLRLFHHHHSKIIKKKQETKAVWNRGKACFSRWIKTVMGGSLLWHDICLEEDTSWYPSCFLFWSEMHTEHSF